jgi:hypothetical protein
MPRKKAEPTYQKLDFDGDHLDDLLWDIQVSVDNFLTEVEKGIDNALLAIQKGDLVFAKGHLEALKMEITEFITEGDDEDEDEE